MSTAQKISTWLFVCAFMVFAMAVIGAITRLTESGLSMVEWRPLLGWIPPMSETEWARVYDMYKQSPEFAQKHNWMALEDFKQIFFWEWFHRLWGRLIGLVYALPLLWFWIKKQIPEGYHLKLLGVLALGGAQGVMGWIMVKSGLIDMPNVSHYRLAAHLSLAFLIFGILLWLGFKIREIYQPTEGIPDLLHSHGWAALGILSVTIIWGAFVAGLDAGMIYNSFPKMGDYWYPMELQPGLAPWIHILENPGWVQFAHRWMAIVTGMVILTFSAHAIILGARWMAIFLLPLMVLIQIGLGVATLLTQVALPLAAAHQACAMILLAVLTYNLYIIRKA